MQLFVWVQTCKHRDPTDALNNIERSDIGTDYTRIHDDNDWPSPEALQAWWMRQWIRLAEEAKKRGCDWMLRLEDDIVVNRHIRYNVLKWPALREQVFGYGTLFCIDSWPPSIFHKYSPNLYTLRTPHIAGAQGQVLPTSKVPEIIEKTLETKDLPVSFDSSISSAVSALGLENFVHIPALVNVSEAHQKSTLSEVSCATESTKSFAPRWKRPKSAEQP